MAIDWSEEFDGAAGQPVNPAIWQPEIGGHGWGNQELQYYTDGTENAALDGSGNLAIVVRRPDRGSDSVGSAVAGTPRHG